MTCLICAQSHAEGRKFCRDCGVPLASTTATASSALLATNCVQCGRENRPGTSFCGGCGNKAWATMPQPATTSAAPPATAAEVNSCPACGAAWAPGRRFCKACGSPSAMPTAIAPVEAKAPVSMELPAAAATMASMPQASTSVSERQEAGPGQETPIAHETGSAQSADDAASGSRPAQAPQAAGKGRVFAIAGATVALVAVVGTLVAYKFLHNTGDVTSVATDATSVTPVPTSSVAAVLASPATAASAVPAPVAQPGLAQAPVVLPTPPGSSPVAQTEAPAPAASAGKSANAEVDGIFKSLDAEKVHVQEREPAPAPGHVQPMLQDLKPARVQQAAPAPSAAPMQDIALNLVRKGEGAFQRQDYSTAMANARAALEVKPGFARAQQLLDEAQHAQQQAMNSISIQ
jgi:hypothetical protein